jgi:hypothetical protein
VLAFKVEISVLPIPFQVAISGFTLLDLDAAFKLKILDLNAALKVKKY